MAKNAKQVTLPAAAQNMAQQAVDHLPADHFVFDAASASSSGAAHSQSIDHVPEQASPHVPPVVPPPVTLPGAAAHMSEHTIGLLPDHLVFNTAFVGEPGGGSEPLDHVPDQAELHVPELVPPDVTLPDAAVEHMSEVAKTHLTLHTDWFA
jgi:hypothetical protein